MWFKRSERPPRPPGWETWRHRVFIGMGWGTAIVTACAFIESFFGLMDWARRHGLHGGLALIAPVTVDTFILGGEAVALVAIMEDWPKRVRRTGYAFAFTGLAISVAGNVGRDGWRVGYDTMATYAIAPLAMFGFIWLGLILVKRHLKPARSAALPDELALALFHFGAALDTAKVPELPSWRAIKNGAPVGSDKVAGVRLHLAALRQAMDELTERTGAPPSWLNGHSRAGVP